MPLLRELVRGDLVSSGRRLDDALIADAIAAAGMPDGRYPPGPMTVDVAGRWIDDAVLEEVH